MYVLHRRTSEDCDKIPVQDWSTLFYTQWLLQEEQDTDPNRKIRSNPAEGHHPNPYLDLVLLLGSPRTGVDWLHWILHTLAKQFAFRTEQKMFIYPSSTIQ
jgi:hypothetical protein